MGGFDANSQFAELLIHFTIVSAVLFGVVLLAVRGIRWELNRRRGDPARRDFMSLRPAMEECKDMLLSSYRRPYSETRAEYDTYVVKTIMELEALAKALQKLRIVVPKHFDDPHDKNDKNKVRWELYLAALEVYASHGDLEGAVQFAQDLLKDDLPTP